MHHYPTLFLILDEIVAIKAIDMKGIKDSISREMLNCEIEALKTLSHHNILKCFDVVRQISHCYIISEFCNEGDLSEILKKRRRFSETEALKILKDIVSGFVEIGKKKFLHRDLKLANIFIHNGTAKIADFGFAKKIKLSSQRQKYNVGSPLYMSPQALKKNIYSVKNDIWSIGIMAYELVHGTTPWECKTEKQLIDKMTRIPVKFKDSVPLSYNLKDFIRKCLEVDQSKRMSLEQLENWLQSTYGLREPENVLKVQKQENLPKFNTHQIVSNSHKIKSEIVERPSMRKVEDKENMGGRVSCSAPLNKNLIDKNNTILVNQINTFRLLFKIYEKLKKKFEETKLLTLLGKQILSKVSRLERYCNEYIGSYDLIQPQKYFNEKYNPSVKKYKSVIKEYFKKYHEEIKANDEEGNLKETLKEFLVRKCSDFEGSEELLMGYWMVEYFKLSKETTKLQLDAIIEPKGPISLRYIEKKVGSLA